MVSYISLMSNEYDCFSLINSVFVLRNNFVHVIVLFFIRTIILQLCKYYYCIKCKSAVFYYNILVFYCKCTILIHVLFTSVNVHHVQRFMLSTKSEESNLVFVLILVILKLQSTSTRYNNPLHSLKSNPKRILKTNSRAIYEP